MQNAKGKMQNAEDTADKILDNFYKEHPEAKKEADKRTAKAVQGRVYQMKSSYKESDDFLSKLMVRHNVNSIKELSEIYDSDEAFENLAAERGESPETMRELERLKMIERNMEAQRKQYEIDRKANEQYNNWMKEAEPLKANYPDFNLQAELENPEFGKLLQRGIPMEHAYKLLHHDELIKAAETAAAEKISKSVNSRSSRPDENGLGNQSNVSMANDVHKLTKKERAELAKRAARGERISF